MNRLCRILFFFVGLYVAGIWANFPIEATETVRPEIRAIWVDAFHDGAKTPEQIDKLIRDCLVANINTIIVQVRRRGDAYYNQSMEPRTEDPVLPPDFDALQYLIDQAHASQLEVHAWLNTMVAWNRSVPPQNPDHVWNLHGPKAEGRDNWVSYYRIFDKKRSRWSDKVYSSYFLDPGHPNALDYTVDVYMHVVHNYDIDGIHLDYSRYEDLGWGYNPVSVERYNALYGTSGLPASDDPNWADWRREQTFNLVRKIYVKAIAVKPGLKVSTAVVTWGEGPMDDCDWEKSAAYVRVAQDWRRWLEEGIIDFVIPMNYFNEWSTKERNWFNQWIEWEKNLPYSQKIVIGIGSFSQYIENTLEQVRRAEAPSELGNTVAGVALFAYGWNNLYSNTDFTAKVSYKNLPRQPHKYIPEANDWLFSFLSNEGKYQDPVLKKAIPTMPIFTTPAPLPEFLWKSRPEMGYLMGIVTDRDGKKWDRVRVIIASAVSDGMKSLKEVYTDGSGWFGLAELAPGDYEVWAEMGDGADKRGYAVSIKAGEVTEVSVEF